MPVAARALQGDLIMAFDDAVRLRDPNAVTGMLRDILSERTRCEDFYLPDAVYEAKPDCYARRMLHRSDELGYTVIAMTWGPGQGTPVHDHCGMWCVEGVCCGELEVVQYELVEHDGDRYRFDTRQRVMAGVGSAGRLIPPYEYHTITNLSPETAAISLHVYAGEMTDCNVFMPEDGDWYTREPRKLCCDD